MLRSTFLNQSNLIGPPPIKKTDLEWLPNWSRRRRRRQRKLDYASFLLTSIIWYIRGSWERAKSSRPNKTWNAQKNLIYVTIVSGTFEKLVSSDLCKGICWRYKLNREIQINNQGGRRGIHIVIDIDNFIRATQKWMVPQYSRKRQSSKIWNFNFSI